MSGGDNYGDTVLCAHCGTRVAQGKVARYEHDACEPRVDQGRQREAQRQLHRDTALMLRRMGELERAAVHDMLAEGRW